MSRPDHGENGNDAYWDLALRAIHDCRGPLRALQASHDMLRDVIPTEGDASQALDINQTAERRLTALMDGLVEFVDISMGTLTQTRFDLGPVVARAWQATLDRTASAARLKIGSLPHVTGDPRWIERLFIHLFDNAVRYTAPAEDVHLTVHVADGKAVAQIRDFGPGIAVHHIERVFEPMTRLHSKSEIEGAGLGLSICQRIAEAHEGQIALDPNCTAGTCVNLFWAQKDLTKS